MRAPIVTEPGAGRVTRTQHAARRAVAKHAAAVAVAASVFWLAAAGAACAATAHGLRERTLCELSERLDAFEGVRFDLVPAGEAGVRLRVVGEDVEGILRALKGAGRGEVSGFARFSVEAPRPKVAVVIDDLGLHGGQLQPLWSIAEPMTYAILPHEAHSAAYAQWLSERDASLIVHVPTEPTDARHMTLEGFLRVDDTDAVRRVRMDRAMAAVPHAMGWSNHMGSRFTTAREAIRALLEPMAADGIVLDSRTSAESVLAEEARRLGRPTAERTVFLDHVRSVEHTQSKFLEAIAHAEATGAAVAIGHPHVETLVALRDVLATEGARVHLVGLEHVVDRPVTPPWRRRCPDARASPSRSRP